MEQQPEGSCPVRLDDDGDIVVVGAGRIYKDKYTPLQAIERTLAAAEVESLAAAVRSPERYHSEVPAVIHIVLGDDDAFDPYLCETDDVCIVIDDARVSGSFEVIIPAGRRLADSDYRRLLAPPLASLGCHVDELEFRLWDGSPEDEILEVIAAVDGEDQSLDDEGRYLRVHIVGATIRRMIAGARLARALLVACASRPLDAGAAVHMIRAGMVEAVVGLPESEWLEVKRRGYQLKAPGAESQRHKLELAQDVARFANGDVPGLLLIGYSTRAESPDREVIDDVTPVKLAEADAEQHRKIIDARVYPSIEGLRVDRVNVGGDRAVLAIELPRQPEYLKPFLVHGALVGDRVDGSFVSIVKRRGAHSVVVDPSQLHAQLVAGRTLLRGGPHRTED